MRFTNKDVDLVIVGANSSSLLLAAQLLKFGIHPIIIDHRKGLSDVSNIVTLDRKSFDILNRLGLGDLLLKYGGECEGLTIQFEGRVLQRFDFCENLHASIQTSFLNIEQIKIDKALLQYLGSQACPVYWDSTITEFSQNDRMVRMAMRQGESTHEIKAKWAVFSDKDSSTILKNLNIDYKRWSFNRALYQYEIRTEEQDNKDQHLIVLKNGFTLANPLDEKSRYEMVSTRINEDSTVKYAYGAVALTYLRQGCLLAGELSYDCFDLITSSVNIHIQDVDNLSWKLALTILGKIDKTVLISYELERRPLAMKVFNRNHWLLRMLFYSGRIFSNLRQKLVLKSFEKQLHVEGHYRRSALSLHHSLSEKIMAGDRLPNLIIYDEKKGIETNLHEWAEKTGFVLLLIGSLSSHLRFNIGQWVKQKYTSYMHVYYLPYSSKNGHIFKAFELNPEQHRMVLVRPDGYIAFINDVLNASLIDTYMEELLRWKY